MTVTTIVDPASDVTVPLRYSLADALRSALLMVCESCPAEAPVTPGHAAPDGWQYTRDGGWRCPKCQGQP